MPPNENGLTPLLSLGLPPEQRIPCSLWPLPVGGVGALGSARHPSLCLRDERRWLSGRKADTSGARVWYLL